MPPADHRKGRIALWRLVAGGFLHFAVPAYLLFLIAGAAPKLLSGRTVDNLLHGIVAASGWFLLGYVVLGIVATGASALAATGRSRDRQSADARRSEEKLHRSIAKARTLFGNEAVPSLTIMTSGRWDHDDPAYRAIAADLAEMIDRADAARDAAPADRREEIRALGAQSLVHIANGFQELAVRHGRLAEGDARAMAGYIESRYGPADFAGDA